MGDCSTCTRLANEIGALSRRETAKARHSNADIGHYVELAQLTEDAFIRCLRCMQRAKQVDEKLAYLATMKQLLSAKLRFVSLANSARNDETARRGGAVEFICGQLPSAPSQEYFNQVVHAIRARLNKDAADPFKSVKECFPRDFATQLADLLDSGKRFSAVNNAFAKKRTDIVISFLRDLWRNGNGNTQELVQKLNQLDTLETNEKYRQLEILEDVEKLNALAALQALEVPSATPISSMQKKRTSTATMV